MENTTLDKLQQFIGDTEKINTCLSMLNPFGILEMVRSGKMVITKGNETT